MGNALAFDEKLLMEEIRRLPAERVAEVFDFVRFLKDRGIERKQQLFKAAKALLPDYATGSELTAFTTLDGEDFHVRRGLAYQFRSNNWC